MSESNANYSQVIDPASCAHCAGTTSITTTASDTPGEIIYADCSDINEESNQYQDDITVVVKSLSIQPVIQFKLLTESSNSTNTWIVDEYEYMPDACGTSKIVYKGNTFFMNVCERDGKATVDLILEIDGKIERNSFILEKSCNSNNKYDMILCIYTKDSYEKSISCF